MNSKSFSFLLTGGSSYVGKALAEKLAGNSDYNIIVTSRKDITYEMESIFDRENVLYVPNLDMTVEGDIDVLCSKIDDFFHSSQFHIINCLGKFTSYDYVENIGIDSAKSIFEGNILSLYAVAHKLIPIMKERGGGHFIGFTSHTSYQSFPLMAAYTASKTAVVSLIKSISNEYLKYGIHSNAIALPSLLTNKEKEMKPNGDFDSWLRPEEIFEIVENLIIRSNGLINGTVIHTYKYSETFFGESYFERINKNCL